MPTNRVTKGNSLKSLLLQPGWSVEDDGYGLLSCRATFVASHGNDAGTSGGDVGDAIGKAPKRGDTFPKDARLTCHRATAAANSNGLLVVTAEYVGIASGNMTTPEVSGRGATSTEPIATHPSFKSKIGGSSSSPLNGAVFTDDGAFKEFSDPDKRKYGVKSYLAPTLSITGHFYTSDITVAKTLLDAQCTVSEDGKFPNGGGLQLIGKLNSLASKVPWSNNRWVAPDESPQLLLTGVSIEDFGNLLKVSFEVLVSADGWDKDIYPYTTRPKRTNVA